MPPPARSATKGPVAVFGIGLALHEVQWQEVADRTPSAISTRPFTLLEPIHVHSADFITQRNCEAE